METQLTLNKVLFPMNSLSISVQGNVKAMVGFKFKAEIVILDHIKKAIAQNPLRQKGAMSELVSFFATPSLIGNKRSKSLSSVGPPKTIRIPNTTLLDDLFQVQKSKVYITGSVQLENHKNTPITAVIFAEAHVISDGTRQLTVLNPDQHVLGALDHPVDPAAINSRSALNIIPIQGADISISTQPT